jgi:hypothetical protein
MPVVPFNNNSGGAVVVPRAKPDEAMILMAGAQMSAERDPPTVKPSGNDQPIRNAKS